MEELWREPHNFRSNELLTKYGLDRSLTYVHPGWYTAVAEKTVNSCEGADGGSPVTVKTGSRVVVMAAGFMSSKSRMAVIRLRSGRSVYYPVADLRFRGGDFQCGESLHRKADRGLCSAVSGKALQLRDAGGIGRLSPGGVQV